LLGSKSLAAARLLAGTAKRIAPAWSFCFAATMFDRKGMAKFWLPVVLWAVLIFVGSTDWLAQAHTSRWIAPILRWFKPDMSWETILRVQALVRKGGHLTEYAVLAVLLGRALRAARGLAQGWDWPAARLAWLLATLYAVSDEFHQFHVPSRTASPADVLIDSIGALTGLLLWWAWSRRRTARAAATLADGRAPRWQADTG
jgi:hypothetical protein